MTGILRLPCTEHPTNGFLRPKIHHPLENSTHKLDISTLYTHLISFITVSYSLILIEISNIVRNDKKLSIRRVVNPPPTLTQVGNNAPPRIEKRKSENKHTEATIRKKHDKRSKASI